MRRVYWLLAMTFFSRTAQAREWFSLVLRQDASVLSGDDVCAPAQQAAGAFACFRADGAQYLGTPDPKVPARVRGMGLATTRALLSFQHFVLPQLAVGGAVGFAFGGGPKSVGSNAHAFLPLHVEATLAWWPWRAPERAGSVRPFARVGGGIGQVDTRSALRIREDRTATPSPMQLDNPNEQTLAVWEKAGVGQAHGGVGAALALHRAWLLTFAALARVSFPAPGAGVSAEVGLVFAP